MGKGNVFNRLIGNVEGGEDTIGNANTELLVLTGWAAWQFAASRHDVLDW